MLRRRFVGIAAFAVLALALGGAIASCSKSSAGLADNCSINSDCNSPLICAFSRCHNACMISSACPAGERCVPSGAFGVCQLPAESACTGTTKCQGTQVCGTDQQCRESCVTTATCTRGAYCLPSGSANACYVTSNTSDDTVLIAAGILNGDGAVVADGSTGGTGPDGSSSDGGADGSSGGATKDGSGSSGGDGGDSSVAVNTCVSAQTAFGNTAQGDSNPNFTSGVGVRTADRLLIFSGYAGGDAGTDNLVYVQAFDPTTANSLGSTQPLFAAPAGTGFVLESASVAPTGQIALAFNYGGSLYYAGGGSASGNQNTLYAAFLAASADAGPAGLALQRSVVEIESARIVGQPHVIWSVATGAFVFSWQYSSNGYFVGTKSFLPSGQATGGTAPYPPSISPAAVMT